ncbi:MAG: Crp/Fnr family transcriptional regulator [bacterium]
MQTLTRQHDKPSVAVSTLSGLPLLSGLQPEVLSELAASIKTMRYAKRDFVMHKGDRETELLFLLEGRLMVVDVSPEGRQTGLNFISPGDFFGELASIDGLPRSATVVAVAQSVVGVLPKHAARKLIFDNPTVAERMLEHIAFKLRAATEYRVLLGIPNAFCRVYSLLQQLARPDPGKLLTIENMPTHEHIGLMSNTSRETVTRALHVVFENGILEKDGRRTIVRQPEALMQLIRENR